jgi:hypothetical protein
MATSKYPFTGPNYAQYGEVPGYVYYPWTDEYYVDVNAVQEYNYATGQQERPKKDPSYWEQIAPVAGGALIYTAASEYGKQIPGMLSGAETTSSTGGSIGSTSSNIGATSGKIPTGNSGATVTVNGQPSVSAAEAFHGGTKAPGYGNTQLAVDDAANFGDATTMSGRPISGSNSGVGGGAGGGAQTVNPDGSYTTTQLPEGSTVNADGNVVDSNGITIGRAVQGIAGLYMIYQGVKNFKDDKVGGTLQVAAGTAATASAAGVSGASAYVWPLAIAMTAWESYKAYDRGKKAATTGRMTDEELQYIHSPYRASAEKYAPKEIGGPLKKMRDLGPDVALNKALLGSKKHDDQIHRDRWRKFGEKSGFLTKQDRPDGGQKSHFVQLADGSMYDVGLDGKDKTASGDRPYNINWEDPRAGQLVGLLNPIGFVMSGGNDKLQSDSVGYLYNAATSSGDPMQNIRHFYDKLGLNPESAKQALDELVEKKKIKPEERDAYLHGVNQVFAGDTTRPQGMITEGGQPQAPQPTPQAQPQGMIPVQPQAGQQPQMPQTAQEADPNRLTPRSASNNPYTTDYQGRNAPQQQQPMGMIPSGVEQRYGSGVAQQVAANPNVGVGGPGYRWDGKQFVRG